MLKFKNDGSVAVRRRRSNTLPKPNHNVTTAAPISEHDQPTLGAQASIVVPLRSDLIPPAAPSQRVGSDHSSDGHSRRDCLDSNAVAGEAIAAMESTGQLPRPPKRRGRKPKAASVHVSVATQGGNDAGNSFPPETADGPTTGRETPRMSVSGQSLDADQCTYDTPTSAVGVTDGGGQFPSVDHPTYAPTIDLIRGLWKNRQAWHKAEKSLTLQAKARCRGLCGGSKEDADVLFNAILDKGDHPLRIIGAAAIAPFLAARDAIEVERIAIEKEYVKATKPLPVVPWVEGVRGFGIGSLAAIVGECGDMSMYANPGKVWKRMGMAVIKGERQQKKAGADGILHGYSPSRRSVLWNVGQAVFKAQSARVDKETGEVNREAGVYRQIYDQRKVYELAKNEAGDYADQAARLLKHADGAGEASKAIWREGKLTPKHIHNRCVHYMEKRLLRDLWVAWRAAGKAKRGEEPGPFLPPAAVY